jgi:cysteinyl-tRNA synthetase
MTEADVDAVIQERLAARQSKDFARADQLRDELADKGVELLDSPTGTTWKIK